MIQRNKILELKHIKAEKLPSKNQTDMTVQKCKILCYEGYCKKIARKVTLEKIPECACVCVCVCVYRYIHTCTHTYIYVCVSVYIYIYVCVYIPYVAI